ncbi:putative WD repeat domain phosphoinositide-interacting protein 2 [Blattamonas nauphoetae]|uniref:WD repeat domain phosphoinositide-interacting protein 2 n=1 Tax=Blattamonas nauphoetae TaxID=2049346 RepID=A0ABQ9XIG4_9EUKA|nr:putative WD repeat domain phosphoinositide-interacting protein 2 [Blattamonas nauphoetae]
MQVNDPKKDITFLNFNQTNACLIVGTKAGYSLWRTNPFDQCTRGFIEHPIHLCEMFFSTSLLAVVCNDKDENFTPRVLYLYNTKIDQVICLLRFNEDIQGVKLNQQHLVVILRASIIIYTLEKIEPVCTLDIFFNQTPQSAPDLNPNRHSIAVLCPQRPLLAYPCDPIRGSVCIARLNDPSSSAPGIGDDEETYGSYQVIEAHDHPVTALAFNRDGDKLATASAHGTIVRIWDTNTRKMITEVKRSKVGKTATIHSLCFSDDGQLLVVSSSSKTVHIFCIEGERKSETSVACIYLEKENITERMNIASFSSESNYIQLACADGNYYHFKMPALGSSNKKCEKASSAKVLGN